MKLVWDKTGEKEYETGVDHGVLYPFDANNNSYEKGVAWNGLTSVQATPSGGEANPFYADNIKYLNLYSLEENGATIEAYMSPKEFDECDGTVEVEGTKGLKAKAQSRKTFGFTWRSLVGNDVDENAGYVLHILYGCKASPSERQYQTVNDSPEPITLSWEITTIAPEMPVEGLKNTALFEITSTDFVTDGEKEMLSALEDKLYGTANTDPELPTIEELIGLLSGTSYKITWKAGDFILRESSVPSGSYPVYSGSVPSQTGKQFIGWNTSDDASTAIDIPVASANATYYAVYTEVTNG